MAKGTDSLRQSAGLATQQQKREMGFPQLLTAFKEQIAAALPKHLSPDRMARIALTCFRQTPALASCDPASIFAAVIMASQLGLEPGVLGQCYIIPYGKQAQFVTGWRGLVDLLSRGGRAVAWSYAVFEGDVFEYELGDKPFIKHKPCGEDEESKITHFYSVGRVKGAEYPVLTVWTAQKVRKHRDRFNNVGGRHYSFQHWEQYGKKVVLLQTLKLLPLSAEMMTAYKLDNAAEHGTQELTLDAAIKNDWVPPEIDATQPQLGAPQDEPPQDGYAFFANPNAEPAE